MIATTASSALSATQEKLAGVAEKVQSFIDKKEIPGAVTLVANHDKVVHLDVVGLADIGAGTPLKTDSIFWIASSASSTRPWVISHRGLSGMKSSVKKKAIEGTAAEANIHLQFAGPAPPSR